MAVWDFLTTSVSGIIDSIGNAIDKLTTTDKEKQQLKNELITKMNEFELALIQAQNDYEKELTERQKNDMISDNKLSKNVRPFVLIFLVIVVTVFAFLSAFSKDVNPVISQWINFFETLLLTAFGFYFGGRTLEKINKIKK